MSEYRHKLHHPACATQLMLAPLFADGKSATSHPTPPATPQYARPPAQGLPGPLGATVAQGFPGGAKGKKGAHHAWIKEANKEAVSAGGARRRREQTTVSLRKNRRQADIAKRRRTPNQPASAPITHTHALIDVRAAGAGGGGSGGWAVVVERGNACLRSSDSKQVADGASLFRQLSVIKDDPPLQIIVDSGTLPLLLPAALGLVGGQSVSDTGLKLRMQLDASWALTNVASGNHVQTSAVVNVGAVPAFVNIVKQTPLDGEWAALSDELRSQAVWALGNIAGDTPECRLTTIQAGALPALLSICQPAYASRSKHAAEAVRLVAWYLSNLCRGYKPNIRKPVPAHVRILPLELLAPALPLLSTFLSTAGSGDAEEGVLADACWAFAHLTDAIATSQSETEEQKRLQTVVRVGAVPKLVSLLRHSCNDVVEAAVRAVGNLVSGDDGTTQTLIDAGVAPALIALATHKRRFIAEEACWALSNMAAGPQNHVQLLLQNGLLRAVATTLRDGVDDVKHQAAWIVRQISLSGIKEHQRALLIEPIATGLCTLLSIPEELEIVETALNTIEGLLDLSMNDMSQKKRVDGGPSAVAEMIEECGGSDLIDALRHHDTLEIVEAADRIIKQHFEDPDEVTPNQTHDDETDPKRDDPTGQMTDASISGSAAASEAFSWASGSSSNSSSSSTSGAIYPSPYTTLDTSLPFG